jgi:phosphoserine phosphatase
MTFLYFISSNDRELAKNGITCFVYFRDLVDALKNRGTEVYLVSGGFDCLIVPEAEKCGIPPNHVIANTILFDKEGFE